ELSGVLVEGLAGVVHDAPALLAAHAAVAVAASAQAHASRRHPRGPGRRGRRVGRADVDLGDAVAVVDGGRHVERGRVHLLEGRLVDGGAPLPPGGVELAGGRVRGALVGRTFWYAAPARPADDLNDLDVRGDLCVVRLVREIDEP